LVGVNDQDHLVCYLGGTLALAARNGFPAEYLAIGKRLIDTCWEMYRSTPTGLSPEIVYFNTAPGAKNDIFIKVCKHITTVGKSITFFFHSTATVVSTLAFFTF